MTFTIPSFQLSSIGPWLTLTVTAILILVLDAIVDPYVGAFSDSLRGAPFGRRHLRRIAQCPQHDVA